MGKDEYLELVLFGRTEEERKIGTIVTTLLGLNASLDDKLETFEVFVGALPKNQTIELLEERTRLLKPYLEAGEEWDQKNPKKEGVGIIERFEEKEGILKPKFKDNLEEAERISNDLFERKRIIFCDLADKLRNMMINLFSNSQLIMCLNNYKRIIDVQKEISIIRADTELEQRIKNYEDKLIELGERYVQAPISKKVLIGLKELSKYLFQDIVSVIREVHGIKKSFQKDIYAGRMRGIYFFGIEEFLKAFDFESTPNEPESITRYDRGDTISFYFNGMLEGEYRLLKFPVMKFREIERKLNYYEIILGSPVHFKIQLPATYKKIVEPVFDDIKKNNKSQIVSIGELVTAENDLR